ncbi:hypothetical protein P5673_032430 [Acropora cervicornis]|uniref:Uncharacterized protein n=1 Tax=Acropora cervicornis TaxID=6130 RepID=A0AAD9URT2_ACRCE|nr:hypothetical protein P5673_032430 [Acropora cervicornis]
MTGRGGRGIRATSAGRFPDTSWRSGTPSLYHEKCAPQMERIKSAPPRAYTQSDFAKCDVVRTDEIWKNRCRNEDTVPNTTSHQFGHRVKSAPARTMQKFERLTNYRMKSNKELLCYD